MPSNMRVNSGDIFNAKIVEKKRNDIMKACQSDNKVGLMRNATTGGGSKKPGPTLPSDSSHIGIATHLNNHGKQTEASTNLSRPQSGKASLFGRRQQFNNYQADSRAQPGPLHRFPTGNHSNAIFNIDVNQQSSHNGGGGCNNAPIHTDLTPVKFQKPTNSEI